MLENVVERLRAAQPGDRPFFGNTGYSLEWHTRYYMVDPLLRALGWDTGLPQEVRIECPIPGGGRADYALFAPGNGSDWRNLSVPRVLVEVKRKQTDLPIAVSGQLAQYVHRWPEIVGLAVMTNGMLWHFYVVQGGTLPKRDPAATVDLRRGSTGEAAAGLKHWLSRNNWPK